MYLKLLIFSSIAFVYAIECPVSNIPIHLPHETLCSSFYSCYNGEYRILRCPLAMYYDIEQGICRSENEVNCGNRTRDDNTIPDEDEYGKQICAKIINGNVSNPKDCASFYMCSNGLFYKMPCPANLYFNKSTRNCDYYYNVNCCEHDGTS